MKYMNLKKVLIISLIAVAIVASVSAVSAGWFGDDAFQTTENGSVFTVPNNDVKLISSDV